MKAIERETRVNFTWPLADKLPVKVRTCYVGSCFSDEFAHALSLASCRVTGNVNGTVYNPISIANSLAHLDVPYTASDLFFFNNLYSSFEHHGRFSAETEEEALSMMEKSRKEFRTSLRKAGLFIMTLSSAVVYKHLKTMRIVANCHKIPNTEFERMVLSCDACRAAIKASCKIVREWNETCPIVITLSPVRHYPGDAALDALSKARLLSAIHDVLPEFKNAVYFPAYEIMTSELRDYRYYNEDLVHPSPMAVKIITERFLSSSFVPEMMASYEAGEKKALALAHDPARNRRKAQVPSD